MSNTLFTIDSATLVFSTIGDLEAQASLTVTESFLFADNLGDRDRRSSAALRPSRRIDNGAFTYASLIDSA